MTERQTLTAADVLDQLHELVTARGSQKKAAEALYVTTSHLNDVLHGRREIGPKILRAMGLRRVVVYEETRRAPGDGK